MNLSFLPQLTPQIGVDLGTSRTRIWVKGQGLVIDQPTAIAINQKTQKVIAVGQDAAEMMGRVQSQIQIFWPIQKGKLYDAKLARGMLQVWFQQVLGWRSILSPVVMVSLPASSTQANRQAITELFYELGAREVYTIVQPLAAAIGAGVPIADASGTLVCQLGAGRVEASLISLGSTVESLVSYRAGHEFEKELQDYIQAEYQLRVGHRAVRRVMQELVLVRGSDQAISLVGKDETNQKPKEVKLEAVKLAESAQQVLADYRQLIANLLAQIPPELAEDVMDKGMLLTGGLAQLLELDAWLTRELKLPVSVVEEPDKVVIEGIAIALEHLDEFRRSISYD